MTLARRLLTSLIVVSFAAVAACGDPLGPGRSELAINRDKWNERGYRDYSFTMDRCFCGETGRLAVTVVGDSVVAAVRVSNGAPLQTQLQPTVNQVFDFIQQAIDEGTYTIEVTYDAQLGYPRSVVYNREGTAYDAGFAYELSDVRPISTNLQSR